MWLTIIIWETDIKMRLIASDILVIDQIAKLKMPRPPLWDADFFLFL